MVSLAKRLEGEPFHLIASHCQNGNKADVVAYVRSQGLAADSPNMTVTSFGGHPGVKGNGYVPYYMVFDHTGKLRHHHMCGAYHGGDGLKMIEWVDRLLEDAPAIYLGEEPYEHVSDLAKQIESRRALGAVAKKLEDGVEADEGDAQQEMQRLLSALTRWRDRELASAERLMATKPKSVLSQLNKLAKELAGSALASPIEERAAALKGSDELKVSIDLQKRLESAHKKISRLKVPKEAKRRGLKQFELSDKTCREAHEKTLKKTAKKLRGLIEGHEALPIAKTIEAFADELD